MAGKPVQDLILLVDDEPNLLTGSRLLLRSRGFANVAIISDSRQVAGFLEREPVAVVVLDLFMPHLSGQEVLTHIKNHDPALPVVMMTASQEVETVVECIRMGAYDYLVKPVDPNRLVTTLHQALELQDLKQEVTRLRDGLIGGRLKHPEAFAPIITRDPAIKGLFHYMEAIAPSRHPVLITGETGVGKELFAQAMHNLSGREGPLVAENVAGLDDTMFTDTLFGHHKGAFTGAEKPRQGRIAQAAGGTLFLDEIGDLQPASQVKLLRLLQEGSYYPLGADQLQRMEAQVVVATNRDLERGIQDGSFRADLFYRLSAHHIQIPPLRQRTGDIPLLLDHFLALAAHQLGKPKPQPDPELIPLLQGHPFPGNVRELQAMVQDAVARHISGPLGREQFTRLRPPPTQPATPSPGRISGTPPAAAAEGGRLTGAPLPTLKEGEWILIEEALRRAGGNQGVAATMLGISRQALNRRLRLRDEGE